MPYEYDGTKYDPSAHGKRRVPPVGNYHVTITGAEEQVSKGGNEMMALTLEIVEGDYAGTKLWHYIVYDDMAISKFGSMLDSLGMDSGAEARIDGRLLLNRSGTVKLKHELYREEEKAAVHYWISDPDAVQAPVKSTPPATESEHQYGPDDEPPAEDDEPPF